MEKSSTTTITLKNQYGEYTIVAPRQDLTLPEIMEELIEPLLLAAGYNRKSFYWMEFGNDDKGEQ